MIGDVIMISGVIIAVVAYTIYEAKNDSFYRDMEKERIYLERQKVVFATELVNVCKSLETHLKIIRENQKTIIDKMPPEKPSCIIANGDLDIELDDEPRVAFSDKKYNDWLNKRKSFEELLSVSQRNAERARSEILKIDRILDGKKEQ